MNIVSLRRFKLSLSPTISRLLNGFYQSKSVKKPHCCFSLLKPNATNALHKQLLSVVQRLAVISSVMEQGLFSCVSVQWAMGWGGGLLSHRSVFNVPSGCLEWAETNDGVQDQIPELLGSARPWSSERSVWVLSTHGPKVLWVQGSSPAACHSNDSLDSSCWPLQPRPFIRAAREGERETKWVSVTEKEWSSLRQSLSAAVTLFVLFAISVRMLAPWGCPRSLWSSHTLHYLNGVCVPEHSAGRRNHLNTHTPAGRQQKPDTFFFYLSGASHAEGLRLAEGKCKLNKYTYVWPIQA